MPMTFTMAAPGAIFPPSPRQPKLPRLGKVWRGWTSPSVYEPVKAVTADSEWLFERSEDGTWAAGHLPTETVVKVGFRSLRACRAYVADGGAQADLARIQAHDRGEHEPERDKSCQKC